MSTNAQTEQPVKRGKLKYLPLDKIKPPKDALRKVKQKEAKYLELVGSVKDKGILNPILVREVGDDAETPYSIVEGLHRYSAAQDAGLTEIPAQILTMNEAETWEAQIIGNLHKIETRPAEYAAAIARILHSNPTMTKKELSAKLSKSTTWIDNQLKLTDLPKSAQKLIDDGQIVVSNGYALANLVGLADDEIENFLNAAQTTPPNEFSSRVDTRVRQIKAERKAGRTPGKPTEFQPFPSRRKEVEVKDELNKPKVGPDLVSKMNCQTPLDGWNAAIKWVLQMDPDSIEAGRQRYETEKAERAAEKERRKQEREAEERKKAVENTETALV